MLVLSLALSACGSSGEEGNGLKGGEADKVRKSAEQVITDPKQACALLTPAALKSYSRKPAGGAKAQAACKARVRRSKLPASADVVVLTLNGSAATAAYATRSGSIGAMALKKINGAWLMDQVGVLTPR